MRQACLLLIIMSVPVTAVGNANGQPEDAGDSSVKPAKDGSGQKPKKAASRKVKQRPPAVTAGREAAAMKFVERHHAELRELLIHLKERVPKEYNRAVRELSRTAERLADFQERDTDRYELELELWKAKSRRQLVAARLRMDRKNSVLRQQLEAALNTEFDLRLDVLRYQRDNTANRLQKLDDQITQVEKNRQKAIERQFKSLTSPRRKRTKPTARGKDK